MGGDSGTLADDIDFDPEQFLHMLGNGPGSQPSNESDEDTDDEAAESSCRTEDADNNNADYMDAMSEELQQTSIGKSFRTHSENGNTSEDDELDVDVNLVRNFLESFTSQDGLSGPVSNLLQSMGLNLPAAEAQEK